VNIYQRRHVPDHMSLWVNLQYTAYVHHICPQARQWSADASMTFCSMLCQTLRWYRR